MKLSASVLLAATFSGLAQAQAIIIYPYSGQYKSGALPVIAPNVNQCFSFDGRWNDKIRSLEMRGAGNGKALYCFFWTDWSCTGNYHYYKAPGTPNNALTLNQIPPSFDRAYSSVQCNFGSN